MLRSAKFTNISQSYDAYRLRTTAVASPSREVWGSIEPSQRAPSPSFDFAGNICSITYASYTPHITLLSAMATTPLLRAVHRRPAHVILKGLWHRERQRAVRVVLSASTVHVQLSPRPCCETGQCHRTTRTVLQYSTVKTALVEQCPAVTRKALALVANHEHSGHNTA